MPVVQTVDEDPTLAVVTVTSPYSRDDLCAAIDAAAGGRGAFRLIVNARVDQHETPLLAEDLVACCHAQADRMAGSFAALVAGDETLVRMSRMLRVGAEVRRVPMTLKLFLRYDDARRWLTTIEAV